MSIIIAEIGMNHDGSLGQAVALIKAAAECGVDGVKFQTHIAEAETLKDAKSPPYFKNESRYDYFKRTAFSLAQHVQLKRECDKVGVEFISSPFSLEAVDLLETVGVKTFKIASGEVSNVPLLEKLSKTRKKMILSSGMSSWVELEEAVNLFRKNSCFDLVLMQCTSLYPCPPKYSGINLIQRMKERFSVPVGFSDHTQGSAAAVLALGAGASVIEKHFTLSHKMYGPDSQFSATPEEMTRFVQEIRDAQQVIENLVDKDKIADSLGEMKHIFEKSIVSSMPLKKGMIISAEHLAYKKPGDGIPTKHYKKLIGKVMLRSIDKDAKLTWDMVE